MSGLRGFRRGWLSRRGGPVLPAPHHRGPGAQGGARPVRPSRGWCYIAGVENEPEEAELVHCLSAPLADAKELLAACEEAEIPAALARDACCGKSGCACPPKMQLLVPTEDVPRLAVLLRDRWHGLLEREGVVDPGAKVGPTSGAAEPAEGEHPPCPACGTAAPLVEGACGDCGLQLE